MKVGYVFTCVANSSYMYGYNLRKYPVKLVIWDSFCFSRRNIVNLVANGCIPLEYLK